MEAAMTSSASFNNTFRQQHPPYVPVSACITDQMRGDESLRSLCPWWKFYVHAIRRSAKTFSYRILCDSLNLPHHDSSRPWTRNEVRMKTGSNIRKNHHQIPKSRNCSLNRIYAVLIRTWRGLPRAACRRVFMRLSIAAVPSIGRFARVSGVVPESRMLVPKTKGSERGLSSSVSGMGRKISTLALPRVNPYARLRYVRTYFGPVGFAKRIQYVWVIRAA